MDVQGWVVIGLALLLFGYLVPHLVTTRQQLAEARVEDRFSTALRVVRAGASAREAAPAEHHGAGGSRPYLHDPRRRTEGSEVKRPTTAGERAATEARRLAAARAARAAEISRRQAAARRRLGLTVVLLLATAGGWAAFGIASAPIVLGAVPTVLLTAVLVAGRRAAKIAAGRNAADRAAMARLELRPDVRSRPAAGSTALPSRGQAGAENSDRNAEATVTTAAPETANGAEESSAASGTDAAAQPVSAPVEGEKDERATDWTPVPVPAPTYTLKASAPRRDVAPYTVPEPDPAPAAAATAPTEAPPLTGLAGSPYAPVTATEAEAHAEATATPEPAGGSGLDLDSVLARRRALGA